ncbi:MAG: hypothetical protein K2Y05_04320, partial [Hyphomicrobiaceae bacterium]|nr:hypothetical protein [Hyphomicrobiaceae bacterium]
MLAVSPDFLRNGQHFLSGARIWPVGQAGNGAGSNILVIPATVELTLSPTFWPAPVNKNKPNAATAP